MVRIVRGRPMRVGERELTPVVEVETHVQRRAFVGTGRLAGEGWGFVRMRPIAVVERTEGGERLITVPDRTAQWLGGLVLAALIIPFLLAVAVRVARKS